MKIYFQVPKNPLPYKCAPSDSDGHTMSSDLDGHRNFFASKSLTNKALKNLHRTLNRFNNDGKVSRS